ncbi:MAG: hypothetical protein SF182_26125 [Deltaproteobacteria bacterium]|nr:hypothetical protein [Deltaproteobacteria bacterium]
MARYNRADFRHAKGAAARRWLHDRPTPAPRLRAAWKIHEWAKQAARDGVHGVSIARKVTNGKRGRSLCVQFYVERKLPKQLVGARLQIPVHLDGIPTDVVEMRRFRLSAAACPDVRERHRPLLPGISAAHPEIGAGTLGGFCRSTKPGDPADLLLALSNSHVFSTDAADDPDAKLYQPALLDGATNDDHFARLLRWTPIRLREDGVNKADAAVGRVYPSITASNHLCPLGAIQGAGKATRNAPVGKVGRTTGITTGTIVSIDADMDVFIPERGAAIFEDQILIAGSADTPRFSDEGDSGALIINTDTREAVGLLFATVSDGGHGLANHFGDVAAALSIRLV